MVTEKNMKQTENISSNTRKNSKLVATPTSSSFLSDINLEKEFQKAQNTISDNRAAHCPAREAAAPRECGIVESTNNLQ